MKKKPASAGFFYYTSQMSIHPCVLRIRKALKKAGDPKRALSMAAYLKSEQLFYGVDRDHQEAAVKEALESEPLETAEDYESAVWELWTGHYREEQYCAVRLARRLKNFRTEAAMPLYERMVRSSTHWDLLDAVAPSLVGDLILEHRKFENMLKAWAADSSIWVRRASLLAHLKHKKATHTGLLANTILCLAGEKEFFIQKAIGWVLREYAKTNESWVRKFVHIHRDKLSTLAKKEALKHI